VARAPTEAIARAAFSAVLPVLASLALGPLAGCARAPSPLTPAWHGAIGLPGHGVLRDGAEIARDADGIRWLRRNDRHWALPRFSGAIARAAAVVARERPGGVLVIGDLSTAAGGGPIPPHLSHRSGVDADLLFFVTALDGAPVASPGFVHFGADGLARDEEHARWLRFDLERQWLFAKALLEDPEARIQWIFVSDVVKAWLLEWALARGDSPETIRRAATVMRQPHPGGVHDDHFHVRTACSAAEVTAGCERIGPRRDWLDDDAVPDADSDEELALALMQPLTAPARP
jgi:penicillin-insensitive murein endopeptidase